MNRSDESREDMGYGERRLPKPPRPREEKPSPWWVVAVLAWIVAFMVFALSGCANVRTGIDDYRATHEAAVALEFRGGFLWLGFGVRQVGQAAEIEVLEGEEPFKITPQK